MKRLTKAAPVFLLILALTSSCASYSAWQKGRAAEISKDWDNAVIEYEKALQVDPGNRRFKLAMQRASREASRAHFEKGKSLRAAAIAASPNGSGNGSGSSDEALRLMQMAGTELELTVKLDPANQFAAVELAKTVQFLQDAQRAAAESTSIAEIKRRARGNVTKAQPSALNPASDEPISLSFPRETPVKDIYRALGNAFGINILFDQAVKDDRIVIELRDVTAQQALERVMQAANHFYKVLDEKTIIVVPDNPQARRDYEDLVIRTFYLSNGDAEQVTNVVRTMIEARNVFPLKALNAITIRDTADKVRIAEKIIEANDKAKAEVVVTVELVQLDLNKIRDVGLAVTGGSSMSASPFRTGADGARTAFSGGTLSEIAEIIGSTDALRNNLTFTIPTATYSLVKTLGNSELLANPELRISEGEKATLHIGQRIPVPVSTFTTISTGGTNPYQPSVSFQYQDVGIKVSMEPRVHHNREVTLKLTVEVSNQGDPVTVEGFLPQPTFATRTIESTIRLKDGETNFLAGLIQDSTINSTTKTPFFGDIPFIGRLFTKTREENRRTDLVLTMTPHIVRIPDITDDDLAPMWVGTTNNLTFRGVTPRIESQSNVDPFTPAQRPATATAPAAPGQFNSGGLGINPGTSQGPVQSVPPPQPPGFVPPSGGAPADPFRRPQPQPQSQPQNPPSPQAQLQTGETDALTIANAAAVSEEVLMRFAPRIAPQPMILSTRPGEQKLWTVVGMDLQGLTTDRIVFRYDSRALEIMDVMFGQAFQIDPQRPPVVTIDRDNGVVKIVSSDGKPLTFQSGGEIVVLRVQGGLVGDTSLVIESAQLRNGNGEIVVAAVSGGRARVE